MQENKLKNFEGGIMCYVSKNQIAKAYTNYIECFRNNSSEHTSGLSGQDIAMTNVIIEGMSDSALGALWNVMHGFKHETFVKVDQCFIKKSVINIQIFKVLYVNETEGKAKVEKYIYENNQIVQHDHEMNVDKFSTLLPIKKGEYLDLLAEWQGDDSGKNHPEVEDGLID